MKRSLARAATATSGGEAGADADASGGGGGGGDAPKALYRQITSRQITQLYYLRWLLVSRADEVDEGCWGAMVDVCEKYIKANRSKSKGASSPSSSSSSSSSSSASLSAGPSKASKVKGATKGGVSNTSATGDKGSTDNGSSSSVGSIRQTGFATAIRKKLSGHGHAANPTPNSVAAAPSLSRKHSGGMLKRSGSMSDFGGGGGSGGGGGGGGGDGGGGAVSEGAILRAAEIAEKSIAEAEEFFRKYDQVSESQ